MFLHIPNKLIHFTPRRSFFARLVAEFQLAKARESRSSDPQATFIAVGVARPKPDHEIFL